AALRAEHSAPDTARTYVLHVEAVDSAGNRSTATADVTVPVEADTEGPVFVSASASPDTLQPPDRKMIPVSVSVEVTDNRDPAPSVRIYAVTANEPIGPDDAVITAPLGVSLRADRDARGAGRVYTIAIAA